MYYAIHKGKTPGIYTTWNEAKTQIYKFKGAKYKKFNNIDNAREYMKYGFVKSENVKCENENAKCENENAKCENENAKCENENVKCENENVKCEKRLNTRILYTDGATSNNQETNKAKGGCGVYFGYDTPKNLSIPFNDKPTNNRCELYAIILSIECSLEFLYKSKSNKLLIYTDSKYCMLMINKMKEKPVQMSYANYNMLMLLYFLLKPIRQQVIFKHIRAHTNKTDIHSIGNMMADKLAVKATSY